MSSTETNLHLSNDIGSDNGSDHLGWEPADDMDGSATSSHDENRGNTIVPDLLSKHAKSQDLRILLQAKNGDLSTQKDHSEATREANPLKYQGYVQQNAKIIDRAREYQQELFERAKDENIIAVLDTGTGKTLIAVMLIRYILDQELVRAAEGAHRRNIWFLANSVPLVNQQNGVLKSNLAASVISLPGEVKGDLWKQDGWPALLAQNDIMVCTPAVLHNALSHHYVNINQINLLIFDEAHHCKKNHPYSTIIRDYYLTASDPRPRLFSMTASPVESKRDIKKTIDDLEELLHSKVVTTSDSSLFDFAHKPSDRSWYYQGCNLKVFPDLYHNLLPVKYLIPKLNAGFQAAAEASFELGTWFAERILISTMGTEDALVEKFEKTHQYGEMSLETKAASIQRLKKLSCTAQQHLLHPLVSKLPDMSYKVQKFYEQLSIQFKDHPETRAIVFVERRSTAATLYDGIRAIGLPEIRPSYLIGGGKSSSETATAKKQEETMGLFGAGIVNLLFTTSVGEEGIDVPQCNLIVRFDLYKTTIQYLQSRGRARMKGSVYAHMIEEGNFDHKATMDWVIESADYLKRYCQTLPVDRLLGKGTKLAQLIAKDSANGSFRTETGAICNFTNCLVILSRYANSLYHVGVPKPDDHTTPDTYVEILNGSEGQFRYRVILPTTVRSQVKGAIGQLQQNKALAKRSAAFRCVARLRYEKLLDENLNSIFHAVKPENLNARLAVSEKKDIYEMKVKPDVWQLQLGKIPITLYAVTLHFVASESLRHRLAPLVMLTRRPLYEIPVFSIFVEGGVEVNVVAHSVECSFFVEDIALKLLTAYTMHAVFADVFNKVYNKDPSQVAYWIAPLLPDPPKAPQTLESLIDYEALEAALHNRKRWSHGASASEWCNKFLVDPLSGKYHYFTEDVVSGVRAFDPEPEEFLPREGKKSRSTSIIYFTDSHWSVKQKDHLAKDWDQSQPVFSAELQTVRRNFLDRPTDQELVRHRCWVAPEPLEIARITPDMARAVLTWPSIIHRLESYMIALEAFEKIGLVSVPPALALESFTKDDNTDDSEEQIHSSKCRGMGKNYERLEFIGDSLLKMTTTITIFCRTKCDEEGMHCRRMELLCNRRLFTVATENLGLEKYIRSTGFNRDTWYPENLVLLTGRGAKAEPIKHAPRTHALSMKTIADVCEASIGAAVMTTKHLPVPDCFELGIRAITRLVESDDHDVRSWADLREMYTPEKWQLKQDDPIANDLASKVSSRIGYTFRYPRLVRSAFTHSSEITAQVPNLQRLEFLGDAVLDWVCVWWLFDSNPDKNPQWLTEHKMAMVSNMFLAALAVKLGFDNLIKLSATKLCDAIRAYAGKVRARLEDPDCPKDFWVEVGKSEEKPPKALSDLVESTLGAMLIDSDFDYFRIAQFFEKHVKPFFEDISLYEGFASMQPTSYIHKKLTGEYGCCSFKTTSTGPQEGTLDMSITAGILVHSKCLAWSSGKSKRVAIVQASKKAISELEGMPREMFRERYGCDCKKGADMEAAEALNGTESP